MTKTKIKTSGIKLIALMLILMLLLPFIPSQRVVAASGGTVTVHFYNVNGYECSDDYEWGAYYWLSRADTVPQSGVDSEFYNANNNPDNKGITFELKLTSNDVDSIKSGRQMGLIMVWAKSIDGIFKPNWGTKDVNVDRMLNLTLDGNNHADVYIIAGDKAHYNSLETAKTAFERIESAKFDDYSTVEVQTTGTLTQESKATVIKRWTVDGDEKSVTVAENLIPTALDYNDRRGKYVLPIDEGSFDMRAFYEIIISGYAYGAAIEKTRLFISPFFKNNFEPNINDLDGNREKYGVIYSKESTTFRVWAPISQWVKVNLYRTGDPLDDMIYAPAMDMTYTDKGVYEATVEGDLNGLYYTYTLMTDGQKIETIDVNAYSSGINGERGYIFDIDATSPEGWEDDYDKANAIRSKQISDPNPVIWELHVRDFSIHPDSGIKYKGKYLAFTENDTTLKGDSSIKTGIAHMKELGITYVHLLPVYDFDKVDETRTGDPSYSGKFNWGYDPKNYNVPEGSYSTDAYNGDVRVREFKEMVMGLHDAGIGVIMDVVYNHTFSLESPLNKTVPSYYYRQSLKYGDEGIINGSFNYPAYNTDIMGNYTVSDASGCGNETASEREMYGQYMRESIMHWARDYHIDGFRFDLMAIHNVGTLNAIREDLDNSFGGAGKGILMYGEPWTSGSSAIVGTSDPASWSADKSNMKYLKPNIMMFNDQIRNGLKGNNDEVNGYLQGGYITGQGDKGDLILSEVQGNIFGQYDPSRAITYTSAHDNYILNDHILASIMHNSDRTAAVYSTGNPTVNNMSKLAATIWLTSKGTPFITAGDEFGRTKFGNHNSYDSSDKVNVLDYARKKVKDDLFDYFKGLLELRSSFSPFRDKKGDAAMQTSNYDNGGVIMYKYVSGAKTTDKFRQVAIIANPYGTDFNCRDTAFKDWLIIGNGAINLNSTLKAGVNFKVAANSAVILALK